TPLVQRSCVTLPVRLSNDLTARLGASTAPHLALPRSRSKPILTYSTYAPVGCSLGPRLTGKLTHDPWSPVDPSRRSRVLSTATRNRSIHVECSRGPREGRDRSWRR